MSRRPGPGKARGASARVAGGVFAVVCAAATVLVAGCGRGDSDRDGGGTLVLALADSVGLDPRASLDDLATPFLALMHEGLVRMDSAGKVTPAHAAAFAVSDDGLTYTFSLHPDRTYEDGTPIAAADYVRALETLFAADPPAAGRTRFWSLEGAVARRRRERAPLGVSAPDSHTVVIRLWARDAALLEKLAQPRYAMPLAPPDREAQAGHALASGAYRLAAAGAGEFTLVRNPGYRGAAPGHLDTLRVLTGVGPRRAALGLASGAIHLLWPVPVEYRYRLSRDPRLGHAESRSPAESYWLAVLNCEVAPMARTSARQAVARALHRQRVVGLMVPLAAPWRGFAPGGARSGAAPGFDPLAARAALDAADYERGIQLPLLVPQNSREETAARGLVSDLGRAGVYGEVRARPRAKFLQDVYSRRGAVAALWSWRPPTSDALSNLAELLLNRSLDDRWGGNLPHLRLAGGALDSLLLEGLREEGPAARAAAVRRLEARLAEEMPFVPVARVRDEAYYRGDVGGVRFHPCYGLDLANLRRAP